MATRSEKERELECLIPVVGSDLDSPPSSKFSDSPAASSSHSAGRENTNAFKEVAIIKHPRVGEYALGFITSTLMLQKSSGAEELCCVYVPTNHLYLGDIFLVNSNNIMRPNLSVREAIEIVISGGLSIPKVLTIVDLQYMLSTRVGKFSIPEV
nr:protein LIKE COV 3-like [Ipomoea batatas]